MRKAVDLVDVFKLFKIESKSKIYIVYRQYLNTLVWPGTGLA